MPTKVIIAVAAVLGFPSVLSVKPIFNNKITTNNFKQYTYITL